MTHLPHPIHQVWSLRVAMTYLPVWKSPSSWAHPYCRFHMPSEVVHTPKVRAAGTFRRLSYYRRTCSLHTRSPTHLREGSQVEVRPILFISTITSTAHQLLSRG